MFVTYSVTPQNDRVVCRLCCVVLNCSAGTLVVCVCIGGGFVCVNRLILICVVCEANRKRVTECWWFCLCVW